MTKATPNVEKRLDELDHDLADLETVVAFLLEERSHHHYILGSLIQRLFGRWPQADESVRYAYQSLYPCAGPAGSHSAARAVRWRRPERRKHSRAELLAMVDEHGLKLRSWERRASREYICGRLRAAGVLGRVTIVV